MSRLFLILPLLLTLFVNPSLADDGDEERLQPAVNQIQINGSSILIYGNELIKNKRDKVFFAAESSSEMIEVPFTGDGDDFLEVILPYEPSAGAYRLGIGKSQKQLHVSELITFVTDTPESNRYTADCTEDSGAFTTLMESLKRSVAATAYVKVVGDCEVGSRVTFRYSKILITGFENGECAGRLVSDAETLTFGIGDGAALNIFCLPVDVYGDRLKFSADSNSNIDISWLLSDAKVELVANGNSFIKYVDPYRGATIETLLLFGQSRMTANGVVFTENAYIGVDENSSLYLGAIAEVGSIFNMNLDNGASVSLINVPDIERATVRFGSRLRGAEYVSELVVDEVSIAQ